MFSLNWIFVTGMPGRRDWGMKSEFHRCPRVCPTLMTADPVFFLDPLAACYGSVVTVACTQTVVASLVQIS